MVLGLKVAGPILGPIPFGIGVVLKYSAKILRIVLKKGAGKAGTMVKTSARAVAKTDLVETVLSKLDGMLLAATGVVSGVPLSLLGVSNVLVRALMCAFDAERLDIVEPIEDVLVAIGLASREVAEELRKLTGMAINPLGNLGIKLNGLRGIATKFSVGFGKIGRILKPFRWIATLFKKLIIHGITLKDLVGWINKLLGAVRFIARIFEKFISRALKGVLGWLIPDVNLPMPSLDLGAFDFTLPIRNINLGYSRLLAIIKWPALRVEELMEELREKMPDDFLPCDMGDSFASVFGGDEEDDVEDIDAVSDTTRRSLLEYTRQAVVPRSVVLKEAVQAQSWKHAPDQAADSSQRR